MWMPRTGHEWLAHPDAVLVASLPRYFRCLRGDASQDPSLAVIEVGVWKGAWSQTLLMNSSATRIVGIDPYPFEGGAGIRADMLDAMSTLGLSDRFRLAEDWESADLAGSFDVIHVDGAHTEQAVSRDLERARALLADDGIIIVDDHRHRWLPGVTYGTFRFLNETDFYLLADSANKAYLVRGEVLPRARAALVAALQSGTLDIFSDMAEAQGFPYQQVQLVKGEPVLLIEPQRPHERALGRARAFVPPVIWSAVARSYFRWRNKGQPEGQ